MVLCERPETAGPVMTGPYQGRWRSTSDAAGRLRQLLGMPEFDCLGQMRLASWGLNHRHGPVTKAASLRIGVMMIGIAGVNANDQLQGGERWPRK
jgi:hypothetical protein